ncbi:MAG TPA: L,D-transpeptidase [Thermomicrobiales bacterium]|nr:L,D-transpeptidase [Thermomicrobiales bacterium]
MKSRHLVRLMLVRASLVVAVLSLFVATGAAQPVSAADGSSGPGAPIRISLNCTASTERIRVVNETTSPITVESIVTLADPLPSEPFAVANRIPAGGTRLWQAGVTATGRNVLARDEILSNLAGEAEGVNVVTSIGTFAARCPSVAPPTGEKWIEVSLGNQHLTAWQGDFRVAEKIVSTGKPGFATPMGTFFINLKFDKETMNQCLNDECWNIPDVPWVMYFTDNGDAFHGAYWHNDFGKPRSHGCVNLPVPFAQWLYDWAPLGTRVWIHE